MNQDKIVVHLLRVQVDFRLHYLDFGQQVVSVRRHPVTTGEQYPFITSGLNIDRPLKKLELS